MCYYEYVIALYFLEKTMSQVNHLVVQTIRDTTRSAYSPHRGTIVEKKKGDWVWWVASAIIVVAIITMPKWVSFIS
jgi:hypothetical protein